MQCKQYSLVFSLGNPVFLSRAIPTSIHYKVYRRKTGKIECYGDNDPIACGLRQRPRTESGAIIAMQCDYSSRLQPKIPKIISNQGDVLTNEIHLKPFFRNLCIFIHRFWIHSYFLQIKCICFLTQSNELVSYRLLVIIAILWFIL